MRHQGKITKWKDDQGFGFITPIDHGESVFVHIKAFVNRQRRPVGNEFVTYALGFDERGRARAESVAFFSDHDKVSTSPRTGTGLLALPVLFLAFVAASVFAGKLPFAILGLYLVSSAIAFVVYDLDKWAAKHEQWRTQENTLHFLSVIGGWPGAFAAQKLLRHKSRKRSFQIVFWTTVVLNCTGLVCLFLPSVSDALRTILGS